MKRAPWQPMPEGLDSAAACVACFAARGKPLAGNPPAMERAPFSAILRRRVEAASVRWALSPRQAEVLERVALGDANKVIAQALGIAAVTVEAHVTVLLRKSGADSRTNLAVRVWAEALDGLHSVPRA